MKTAIIYDKWLSGMGGGEVVACNMARVLKDEGYRVIFACDKIISSQIIKDKLGIDVSDIDFIEVPNEDELKLLTTNNQLLTINLFINISFMDYSYGIGERNIYYVHFPSKIRSGLFNYVLLLLLFIKKYFPKPYSLTPRSFQERIDDRLRAGIYPDMKKRLNSYDTFITHSEYVKRWVKKLWHKDAVVLYPPIKFVNPHALSLPNGLIREPVYPEHSRRVNYKQNWITSIGRFFTLGHGKKQEVMIDAFKKLYDSHRTSEVEEPSESEGGKTSEVNCDLELHLIGGVGNEPSSLRFIKQLQEQAKGYPIYFHFNINRQEVEEILCKSKVYWHAAGYGEDLEHDPIKFEHFGIAPIEAISAGCTPILYDGGGLTEIIHLLDLDKKNLYQTLSELISNTHQYLKENIHHNKLLKSNLEKYFSSESFAKKFKHLIYE